MEAEAVLKAAFPGGSSGSLAASAAGREAMPGTGTGDWQHDLDYLESRLDDGLKTSERAGAEPVGDGQATSQPMSTTEPQREDEGVSAGRTSPAPLLVPARKPGSHRRGPPKGKTQAKGEYKDLKPSELLDQMLSDLERRREMEAEAVLKAAFPGGSSGSLAASAAGREAMPGTGTGDWQHDLDYLESRLDDGLKTSERAGAEPVGDGQATSQPMSTTEPQREDEGVSAGRTSPAPLLVPARKPGSHRRGPPKGKNKATGDKKSLESNDVLKQIVKELQGGQEMEAEAVLKAAFPGGSSGSLAASAAGREAMPGTGTGDWQHDLDYLESRLDDGLKTSERAGAEPVGDGQATSQPMSTTEPQREDEGMDQMTMEKTALPRGSRGSLAAPAAGKEELPATGTGPGDSAGTTTRVPSDQKGKGDGFCQGTRCLLELMAIVSGAVLVLMLCCVGVWYCWKRKRYILQEKLKAGGWSPDLYSQKSYSSSSASDQFSFAPSCSALL
ncbi:uncharacterized protein LOC116449633 [Corvus moneduloides]|uniref:uncharacterized protein LOC116449633 n=1 Tax=Corvus moneduloides TaxID=1196302 RepID=UPI00136476C2|nr:uncharacterized protein LOC116449633 [Corvus moneduloides]